MRRRHTLSFWNNASRLFSVPLLCCSAPTFDFKKPTQLLKWEKPNQERTEEENTSMVGTYVWHGLVNAGKEKGSSQDRQVLESAPLLASGLPEKGTQRWAHLCGSNATVCSHFM